MSYGAGWVSSRCFQMRMSAGERAAVSPAQKADEAYNRNHGLLLKRSKPITISKELAENADAPVIQRFHALVGKVLAFPTRKS